MVSEKMRLHQKENLTKLGIRLSELREKKDVSQLEVGDEIGVSDRTIRRWHNSEIIPSSAVLRNLAEYYEVSYSEELYWMGLAGHVLPTRMATASQLEVLIGYFKEIQEYQYPAYILDYQMNYVAVNSETVGFIGDYIQTVNLLKQPASALSIVFDTRLKPVQMLKDRSKIQEEQVRRAWFRNLHRRHEPFFLQMKERLAPGKRCDLLRKDYNKFLSLWSVFETEELPKYQQATQISSFEDFKVYLGYMSFDTPHGELSFRLISESIDRLPNLFEVIKFFPETDKDREIADIVFADHHCHDETNLQYWELFSFQEMSESYNDF